jgi:nucleoside-diphosphate-sugar epimerase
MITYLITGSTGLIGGALVDYLRKDENNRLILPVRNVLKAEQRFGQNAQLIYITHDFSSRDQLAINEDVDYIVHGACPTASKYMAECPVETIDTIINGTRTMLQLAKKLHVKGMVFLSSMEVYGTILADTDYIDESMQGYVDSLQPRSSYPMAKRMAETMCHSFAYEYSVPIVIARLAQTFGPEVDIAQDMRVFAYFTRCAREGQDIILKTEGLSKRMYLHTWDAVSAIMLLLTKGVMGEAYNVANKETYSSIREIADYVKENFCPSINIIVQRDLGNFYPPDSNLPLSTNKIEQLGWKPQYGLKEMFSSLIKD